MIKTNKENLLKQAVIGQITNPAVESLYRTTWDGRPKIELGRGGIRYNVKVGDPCFGLSWGDKAEPGVSVDGIGNDREKMSFRNYACIGNQAKVMNGLGKGGVGTVVGKIGYLLNDGHHVVIHFDDEVLEKLAIGDKIQVKSHGVGLQIKGFEDVRIVSTSPKLLESLKLKVSDSLIHVTVVKVIPSELVGLGSGGAVSESSNWDVQTCCPETTKEHGLEKLRIGDIVALEDILTMWGRGYYKGALTIGVISCGASELAGQGMAVTTLLTSREGKLEPVIEEKANIAIYLKLRDLP